MAAGWLLGLTFGVPSLAAQQDTAAVAEFNQRVEEYVTLHQELQGKAPKLPKETTPEQIAESQSALAAGIRAARAGARPGNIFTPAMTRHVKQLFVRIFTGPDGRLHRAKVMDEYPGGVRLAVDAVYPSAVPVATMPAEVLAALPKLPDELEYRFVGEQFILFDRVAQTIPDFIVNALPAP